MKLKKKKKKMIKMIIEKYFCRSVIFLSYFLKTETIKLFVK